MAVGQEGLIHLYITYLDGKRIFFVKKCLNLFGKFIKYLLECKVGCTAHVHQELYWALQLPFKNNLLYRVFIDPYLLGWSNVYPW